LEQLRSSLIRNIAAAGSGQYVGNSLCINNSRSQDDQIIICMVNLQYDSFIMHICGPAKCRPLAKVYILGYEELVTTGVGMNFKQPYSPGALLFE